MGPSCQGHRYRARVRQLLPEPISIDPAEAHVAAHRPPPTGRPWVLLNMVVSADGATAVDGVSGELGGPEDKVVFSALRAVADVILVAAGTARAEGYGPPRTSARRQAERVERGQAPFPRLALVTRTLDLDPAAAMFTEAPEPPLVYTVPDAPADRRSALGDRAELVTPTAADGDDGGRGDRRRGPGDVDLAAVLADLGRRGARTVLVEGGPALNGQLVAGDLVDELDVTLAPALVGGESARVAHGPALAVPTGLVLAHLWEADGVLFARYVRDR
jgi:5-amino-6-(5-phosphoribosylamino)uracil reductase